MGAVGSNHVLATSIFGHKLGMKTNGVVFDQPIAEYARRNILLMYYHGAKLAKNTIPLFSCSLNGAFGPTRTRCFLIASEDSQ